MSNELESDSAMVMNLKKSFGVDGAGYDETETGRPQHCQVHKVVEVDELRHKSSGGGSFSTPV